MYPSIVRKRLVACALAAFLSTASSAYAEILKFKANIDAAQEVPPNDSKGKGMADLTYDTASKNLTWTITFDGLTGPATVAGISTGLPKRVRTRGRLLIGQNPYQSYQGQRHADGSAGRRLHSGRWYINVHTAANKGGEIRGQVTK